jgi:hypothetical protein
MAVVSTRRWERTSQPALRVRPPYRSYYFSFGTTFKLIRIEQLERQGEPTGVEGRSRDSAARDTFAFRVVVMMSGTTRRLESSSEANCYSTARGRKQLLMRNRLQLERLEHSHIQTNSITHHITADAWHRRCGRRSLRHSTTSKRMDPNVVQIF